MESNNKIYVCGQCGIYTETRINACGVCCSEQIETQEVEVDDDY